MPGDPGNPDPNDPGGEIPQPETPEPSDPGLGQSPEGQGDPGGGGLEPLPPGNPSSSGGGPAASDPQASPLAPDGPFVPYVGVPVNPYTNAPITPVDSPFVVTDALPPPNLFELVNNPKSGKEPVALGYIADSSPAGLGPPVSTTQIDDSDGNWWGERYVYANGTVVLVPNGVDVGSEIYFPNDPLNTGPPTPKATPPTALTPQPPPSPQPVQNLPPLPPPDIPPPAPSAPAGDGPIQWTSEVVVEGIAPFSPDVSNPAALQAAEGRGHIEWGDLKQTVKGGYNGLVDILPLIAGPILGPLTARIDIPKATIDQRYGGGAIIGEHLSQNLALEGAAALPVLGRLGRLGSAALKTEAEVGIVAKNVVTVERIGQTPVIAERAGTAYQVYATGKKVEEFFLITKGGKSRLFEADAVVNKYLVEAKWGQAGKWYDRFGWHGRIYNQVRDYLIVADKLGYKGVRYAASDQKMARELLELFKKGFPEAVKSGQLKVLWVPHL